MPLLCSNTQLDRAIERLDPVIAQFPGLISARHARGTAHFRKWLNSAPIQVLQLRPGPLTYAVRFGMGDTQLGAADTLALHRARRDFTAILERELLPNTLAGLAMLEAYAGHLPAATRRAEEALRLAPGDPGVRNQVGVIRFLSGDVKEAASEFLEAARGSPGCRPWVQFNRAKSAALLNDPAAFDLLQQYLLLDPTTEWRREVLELLGDSDEVSARMARDAPVVLPGVTLHTTLDQIVRRLGPPSREEQWRGLLIWAFDAQGLDLVLCPTRGVLHLELGRTSGGMLDGVRIGDPLRIALSQWGNPVEAGEGQMVFWAGNWGIGLEHDDHGCIVTLSLGSIQ